VGYSVALRRFADLLRAFNLRGQGSHALALILAVPCHLQDLVAGEEVLLDSSLANRAWVGWHLVAALHVVLGGHALVAHPRQLLEVLFLYKAEVVLAVEVRLLGSLVSASPV